MLPTPYSVNVYVHIYAYKTLSLQGCTLRETEEGTVLEGCTVLWICKIQGAQCMICMKT